MGVILGLAVFSAGTITNSASVPMDVGITQMETSVVCADGSCFRHEGGLKNFYELFQKVNKFDPQGIDRRFKQIQTGAGAIFAPIGRIITRQPLPFVEDGKAITAEHLYGTGFLISPCLAMTTYHSIFGRSLKPSVDGFSVDFIAAGEHAIGQPLIWGPIFRTNHPGDDWAIIELGKSNCIGSKLGWLTIPKVFPSDMLDKELTSAGYPVEKYDSHNPNQLWRDPISKVRNVNGGFGGGAFLHDGAFSAGQSGSPIGYVENGIFKVIGMYTGDRQGTSTVLREYDDGHANYALGARDIYAKGAFRLVADEIRRNGNPINKLASE